MHQRRSIVRPWLAGRSPAFSLSVRNGQAGSRPAATTTARVPAVTALEIAASSSLSTIGSICSNKLDLSVDHDRVDRGEHDLLARLLIGHGTAKEPISLARSLIAEAGCIGAVVSLSPARMRACGADARAVEALGLARQVTRTILRRELEHRPLIDNGEAAADYLHAELAHLLNEQLRVLYLDTRHRLIRDEFHGDGTVNEAPVYPREIIRRALEIGAANLLLAHNHPSGDATPSRDDIVMTRAVIDAGRHLEIRVVDHLIISSTGHVSMRASGLI